MNRRKFIGQLLMVASLGSGGCVTSRLIKQAEESGSSFYEEGVSSFLIAANKKQIVFLGGNYHYIINAPTDLIAILESPLRKKLAASFVGSRVTLENDFYTLLGLSVVGGLTQEEAAIARGFGFEYQDNFAAQQNVWVKAIMLSGTRYLAGDVKTGNQKYRTNKPYTVKIEEQRTSGIKKALAVMVSPVTLAVDGVLLVGGVVLFPISIPLGLVYYSGQFTGRYGR